MTVKPKGGLTQFVEVGVGFISNLVESSFEDRERGTKYVPYFVTLFFFLLFNNWLGLVLALVRQLKSMAIPASTVYWRSKCDLSSRYNYYGSCLRGLN